MTLLKKLVHLFPLAFLKQRLHKKMLAELSKIDLQFGSPRIRYVDNLRDLYDCLHNVDVSLAEDFKLFREQRIQVNYRSSQKLSELIWELRTEKSPAWEPYTETTIPNSDILCINWYSNQSSIQDILDYGLDIIKNYIDYITYKDLILTQGEEAEKPYPPKFYPEEIAFFESRYLKMLVSDLITVYWLALDSNVSR